MKGNLWLQGVFPPRFDLARRALCKLKKKGRKGEKKNVMCIWQQKKPSWEPHRLFWLSADRSFLRLPRLWLSRDRWKKKCYHSIDCCSELWRWRYQLRTCDFSAGTAQRGEAWIRLCFIWGSFPVWLDFKSTGFQKVKPPAPAKCVEEGSNKDYFVVDSSSFSRVVTYWSLQIRTLYCVLSQLIYSESIRYQSHWLHCLIVNHLKRLELWLPTTDKSVR